MHEDNQHAPQTGGRPTQHADKRAALSSRFAQFERRQKELWRFTFAVLFALAVFFAWTSWASIRSFASRYEAFAHILVVVVIALFVAYVWKKTQELSELRGLMRGLEHRDEEPPSDKQLDQLFAIIARSQQGFRDLIDSFDDVLLALSLDGQIRAVNRSFSDLVDTPFQEIIGRPLADFVQENSGDGEKLVERAMPRFTELFESLQEGIYITTPDGAILDVNPALVRMLGYDSKEDVLKRQVPEIFVDRAERKIVKEQVERQPMIQGREITLIRKDGTSIVCLNTAAAVRDNSGRVVRYQGALMDITERREMERRLHQQ